METKNLLPCLFNDLQLLSRSKPNERLPKEEHTRCCLFSFLRPQFSVLCAEHGYGSVDDYIRTECDLWGQKEGASDTWLELKHCWAVTSWNNKYLEQLCNWEADIAKLKEVDTSSERLFLLIGFLSFDPKQEPEATNKQFLINLRSFYPLQNVEFQSMPFSWRGAAGITTLAAWLWRWTPGQKIQTPA